jgi:hypothetical protein
MDVPAATIARLSLRRLAIRRYRSFRNVFVRPAPTAASPSTWAR